MTETIRDVADTAFMVAMYRALESERPDALFHDPLAGLLAGEEGRRIVAGMHNRFPLTWTVPVRTVIVDDFIRSAVAKGTDVILNLGAGLDTRPYRMELAAPVSFVEVDQPGVLALKDERLAGETPRNPLERVPLDLRDGDARRRLFAHVGESARRVLVLTEGVIPYLSETDVATLADDLASSATFRSWIVDYLSAQAMRLRQRSVHARRMRNAPFLFDPADWLGFFGEHGWEVGEMRYLAPEAMRLGRRIPVHGLMRLLLPLRLLVTSREKREAFARMAGFALLERNDPLAPLTPPRS